MPRGKRYSEAMRQRLNEVFVKGEEQGWTPSRMFQELKDNATQGQELPSRTGFYHYIRAKRGPTYRYVPPDPVLEPWQPGWPEDPEEIALLMELQRVSSTDRTGMLRLDTRVAKWALRIKGCFDSPLPRSQVLQLLFSLAAAYASRERVSEILGEPMYTADMDSALMYRPWSSADAAMEYQTAIDEGTIPKLDDREEGINFAVKRPHLVNEFWDHIAKRMFTWVDVALDDSVPEGEKERARSYLQTFIDISLQVISKSAAHRDGFVDWVRTKLEVDSGWDEAQIVVLARTLGLEDQARSKDEVEA